MKDDRADHPLLQSAYDWIQCVTFAIIPVIFVLTFVVHTQNVSGQSMMPTLLDGDRMVVSNLFTLEPGDIVVFAKSDFEDGAPLVKRIIATAGQTVDIDKDAGTVSVDGRILQEDYINAPTHTLYDVAFPLTVPEGHVFVMGDNRNNSLDSRYGRVGLVDVREVLGKVYAVIFPISDARFLG